MIAGSLAQWQRQIPFAHPVFRQAIEFMEKTDFRSLEDGKYPIQGDDLYASVMTLSSKPASEQPAEKHESYLDIHLLLEGAETIGWKPEDESESPSQIYDSGGDYALYAEVRNESYLKLQPGMFVALFPGDVHRPGITDTSPAVIRKVVVKIRCALLEM